MTLSWTKRSRSEISQSLAACMIVLWLSTMASISAFQQPLSSKSNLHAETTRTQTWLSMSEKDNEDASPARIYVAMTREDGKNGKLSKALENSSIRPLIEPVELPCIAHADGPDLDRLGECLLQQNDEGSSSWDYVAVTSPEAARVLARVWDSDQMSNIRVAAVGKATETTLRSFSIDVAFTPSKAYAKTLVQELPGDEGTTLLYPASCRAPGTLADGLTERGFVVTRLNTYDTVTAEWTPAQRELAQQCQIACFASPSSIKGWLHNYGGANDTPQSSVLVACIGETSAKACRELGWDADNVFRPDSPGIEGWVEAIQDAVAKRRAVVPSTTVAASE